MIYKLKLKLFYWLVKDQRLLRDIYITRLLCFDKHVWAGLKVGRGGFGGPSLVRLQDDPIELVSAKATYIFNIQVIDE